MIERLRSVIKEHIYNAYYRRGLVLQEKPPEYYVDEIIARYFTLSFGKHQVKGGELFSTLHGYYSDKVKNMTTENKDE